MKSLFGGWMTPEERQAQMEENARTLKRLEKNNSSDSDRGGFGAVAALDQINSDINGSDASSDFDGDCGCDCGYDGGWDCGDCGGDGGC